MKKRPSLSDLLRMDPLIIIELGEEDLETEEELEKSVEEA